MESPLLALRSTGLPWDMVLNMVPNELMETCRDVRHDVIARVIERLTCNDPMTNRVPPGLLANGVSERLRSIDIRDTAIGSLSAFGRCASLVELDISNTHVSSLEPIVAAAANTLAVLYCENCMYMNVDAVRGFTVLKELHCSMMGQTTFPASLPATLEKITCCHCKLKDITALGTCPNLVVLELHNTEVTTLAPLINCVALSYINVEDTDVRDLTALAACTRLQTLLARRTCVEDVSPLARCLELTKFVGSQTDIANLDALLPCRCLTHVDVSDTNTASINGLASSTSSLAHLDISGTLVDELGTSGGEWRNMTCLKCAHSRVSSLRSVSSCATLRHLDVQGSRVVELEPLRTSGALEFLDCSHTDVHDLTPLGACNRLSHLACSYTSVVDLDALLKLTSLTHVDLSCTDVRNIEPLRRNTKLQTLRCTKTHVQDINIITEMKHLHDLQWSRK